MGTSQYFIRAVYVASTLWISFSQAGREKVVWRWGTLKQSLCHGQITSWWVSQCLLVWLTVAFPHPINHFVEIKDCPPYVRSGGYPVSTSMSRKTQLKASGTHKSIIVGRNCGLAAELRKEEWYLSFKQLTGCKWVLKYSCSWITIQVCQQWQQKLIRKGWLYSERERIWQMDTQKTKHISWHALFLEESVSSKKLSNHWTESLSERKSFPKVACSWQSTFWKMS